MEAKGNTGQRAVESLESSGAAPLLLAEYYPAPWAILGDRFFLFALLLLSLLKGISGTTAVLAWSPYLPTCPDFVEPVGAGPEDVQAVANLWTASAADPDSGYDPAYDQNSDSVIDTQDIVQVAAAIGTCEALAVFVGAGDIADCSRDEDEATALLLDAIPGTVFTVGDNAYPTGSDDDFNNCYEPTWGRHKARTHPAVGDNEYDTSGATGYFNYFGAAAGDPSEGYYSYDVGGWHIVVLNSNCSQIGGCDPDSAQGQWLQADLAANATMCILTIHHEPLFSSNGGDADLRDFWVPLYAYGADIVLSGHRHMYERFAQQDPDGVADPGRGIRQFVVGTGGASLSSLDGVAPNSEVRDDNTHGVLKFTLHPTSYDWEFIPIAGQTFTDSGSAACVVNAGPVAGPPTATDDSASTTQDTPAPIDVAANDTDPDGNLKMDLDLGDKIAAVRVPHVDIPQGAQITDAFVEFTADEARSDPTALVIHGEAADAPPTFTLTAGDLSTRPETAAAVTWDPVAAFDAVGETHPTPSLESTVQELVNRDGWTIGNPMVFTIAASNAGQRAVVAFDGNSVAAPRLVVDNHPAP